MEYRTGMYQVVHSAPNGRAAVMRWKITACVVLTIGLTAAVYGIDIGICTTFTECRIWQHRR